MLSITRHPQNPIVVPGLFEWRKATVFNPAVIIHNDKFYMIERTAGSLTPCKNFLGLLVSDDGVNFTHVQDEPIVTPDMLGFPYGSVQDPRIVKKYLSEHYRDDVKASEIAEWLKITPSYFSLLFKQSTGKSFKEYMNELRMEQAKHLLATTHEKVFEIANEVGYKDYKYFVSVFKSYTGMTPKEYRALTAAL